MRKLSGKTPTSLFSYQRWQRQNFKGNEFSYHMLLGSHLILNRSERAECFSIFPFVRLGIVQSWAGGCGGPTYNTRNGHMHKAIGLAPVCQRNIFLPVTHGMQTIFLSLSRMQG